MAQGKRPANKVPPRKNRGIPVRRLLSVLKAGGDLRSTKVRRLCASVRAKRYENDLKLAIAVERLLTEL